MALDYSSFLQNDAVILEKRSCNYRKSMRAPVAVACNRIISAEAEAPGWRAEEVGAVFRRAPDLLKLLTPPFSDKTRNIVPLRVCTRLKAQLSFGNCSIDAYMQHGSETERTNLKRSERGGSGWMNSKSIPSNIN